MSSPTCARVDLRGYACTNPVAGPGQTLCVLHALNRPARETLEHVIADRTEVLSRHKLYCLEEKEDAGGRD